MKKATLFCACIILLLLAACSGDKSTDAKNTGESKNNDQITQILDEKERVLQGSDDVAFVNYIVSVRSVLENDDSLAVIDFFPYDETKSFIETNCTPVVCAEGEGAFYDSHPYGEGEDYWYDPLEEKSYSNGEIGRYHYILKPIYCGDLLVIVDETKWYGLDADDPNNSLEATLYYQDQRVSKKYLEIEEFLKYATSDNAYCADNGDGDYTLFTLLEGSIIILQDALFMLQYK